MSQPWQKVLLVLPQFVIGIVVLRLVAKSLRDGVNNWTNFGRLVRAPGDYDFWVVNFLFAFIAIAFVGTSIFVIIQAFQ